MNMLYLPHETYCHSVIILWSKEVTKSPPKVVQWFDFYVKSLNIPTCNYFK